MYSHYKCSKRLSSLYATVATQSLSVSCEERVTLPVNSNIVTVHGYRKLPDAMDTVLHTKITCAPVGNKTFCGIFNHSTFSCSRTFYNLLHRLPQLTASTKISRRDSHTTKYRLLFCTKAKLMPK